MQHSPFITASICRQFDHATTQVQRQYLPAMPTVLLTCSVTAGQVSVSTLMQTQQGALKGLSFVMNDPSSCAVASEEGSICIWNARVSILGSAALLMTWLLKYQQPSQLLTLLVRSAACEQNQLKLHLN